MDVDVSTFRAELKDWIELVRRGGEVLVTKRGLPVARLVSVDAESTLERLVREGIVGAPGRNVRPRATNRPRVRAKGRVSELVERR